MKPQFDYNGIIESHAVGSRVTCDPPPTDTDEDWLFLVTDVGEFAECVISAGFVADGSVIENQHSTHSSSFLSLKQESENINVIATADPSFFRAFMAATRVAKRLNLLDKEDRIALFQAVLYRNPATIPALQL